MRFRFVPAGHPAQTQPRAIHQLAFRRPATLTAVERGGRRRLELGGDLDLAGVDAIRGALLAELADHKGVVVDLTGLDFLASVGLGLLLEAADRAHPPGVLEFQLPTGGPVRRVLELTGLTMVLTAPTRSLRE